MTSANQQLFVGLAFAVVLIYLLIVVNFHSWLDPFVIVMALPSALAALSGCSSRPIRRCPFRRSPAHHVHGVATPTASSSSVLHVNASPLERMR